MPIDPSIILGVKPIQIQDPIDSYSKVLGLKTLMGQQDLQGVQLQEARRSQDAQERIRTLLATNPKATSADVLPIDYKTGFEMRKAEEATALHNATIGHTNAQTGEIQAGQVAGHLAALTKDPSDQGVQTMYDLMTSHGVPAQAAQGIRDKLMGLPVELRAPWATAQAASQKTGQEALKLLFPAAHMQDAGGSVVPVTTSTLPGGPAAGSAVPGGVSLTKTVTPDAVLSDATRKSEGAAGREVTMRGQNMTDKRAREMNGILEGQSIDLGPTAKAIANYDVAPPTLRTSSPNALMQYNRLMTAVKAENPDYDAKNYSTSQAALTAFAKGKQGDSTRFISTAADHVNTLRGLADALNNGKMTDFNRLAQAWAEHTGQTPPTNFDTAKNIVGGEVVKGIVGAGGGVEDRAKAQAAFDRAKSPKQLSEAIDTVTTLLGGQLRGLEQQYKAGTGRKDFREKYLTEGARKTFGEAAATPAPTAAPVTLNSLPDPAQYKGKMMTDTTSKTKYVSDGAKWVRQ